MSKGPLTLSLRDQESWECSVSSRLNALSHTKFIAFIEENCSLPKCETKLKTNKQTQNKMYTISEVLVWGMIDLAS